MQRNPDVTDVHERGRNRAMKWFRGTLVVLIVAAMFAAVSGVARADDGGGTVTAKCSFSFSGGVLGVTCTTTTGVTYTCTLQRTAIGTFGLACSSSATATQLKCTFTFAPFSATCRKE
jgi:hypothetical protein